MVSAVDCLLVPDPILSIVTPCLNQAQWVAACLESVAVEAERAGPGRVEHIIMDGGSTDGSAAIIEAHAKRHPGLVTHWASESDGGQSDAINKGCAIARGAFATWINSDDWFEPGGVLALIRAIEANPDADVLVGRCRFVDEAGETIWDPSPPEPMSAANFLKPRSQWFNAKMIVQPEAVFRLSAFNAVGGLNVGNHYSMDHELWVEFALRGGGDGDGFVSIDERVSCLRVHAGQKSGDNRKVVRSMLVTGERVLLAHRDALGDEFDAVKAELDAVGRKLRTADVFAERMAVVRRMAGQIQSAVNQEVGKGKESFATGHRASGHAAEEPFADELRLLARPHARKAFKVAAKHLGKRVRIGVASAFPETLKGDLARAFRRFELVLVGGGEGGADKFDVVVLDNLLAQTKDTQGLIESLWSSLRPGGVFVVLNELVPAVNLFTYLESIQTHLSNHLAANHDLILHPDADPYLDDLLDGSALVERYPSCLGVDVGSVLRGLSPTTTELFSRAHGSYWFHPVAPFPFVPTAGLAQEETRLTAVFLKPA